MLLFLHLLLPLLCLQDAASADTEALSTVMAVKNARADIRVLVQLQVSRGSTCAWVRARPHTPFLCRVQRPRKRNHLKVVPGWSNDDKSIAGLALAMTLVGE